MGGGAELHQGSNLPAAALWMNYINVVQRAALEGGAVEILPLMLERRCGVDSEDSCHCVASCPVTLSVYI